MDPGFIEKDAGFSNPATNVNVVLLALSLMNSAGAAKLAFHATADFRLRSIDPCFRTLCGTTLNDDRQSIAVAVGETSSDTYWKLVFQEMELAVAHEKSRGVSTLDFHATVVPLTVQGLSHADPSRRPPASTVSAMVLARLRVSVAFATGVAPAKLIAEPVAILNPGRFGKSTSSQSGGVYATPGFAKSTASHAGGV